MAKKLLTFRVWMLLIFLLLSLLAIAPRPWAEGIEIKKVEKGSTADEFGLRAGHILKSINDVEIKTVADYKVAIADLENEPRTVVLGTDRGEYRYNITNDFGFTFDNLTIVTADYSTGIDVGGLILELNGVQIENDSELKEVMEGMLPKKKVIVNTDKGQFSYLSRGPPEIEVREAKKNNLNLGLDLAGGTRVLIRPVAESVTENDISDLIKVMSNRLNVYGLADIKIRSANDLTGNRFVLLEIAGATPEDIEDLIGQQGKFEAKIGEEVAFEGGKKDVLFVCRNDGSCSGVRDCSSRNSDNWFCKFEFTIKLSQEAAKRHADITRGIDVTLSTDGREILNKTIDFYLDNRLVDSLQISADLKGQEATDIAISGPGVGGTKAAAVDDAVKNMDKLQTILITGSLPFDIEIVKLDTLSPIFGQEFLKNAIFVGLLAIASVGIVIFIRYRNLKVGLAMLATMLSEIFIILGFAAFIQWNLDLAAIAGIMAAVGTGVDDQIVITDEVLKGAERFLNWKQKIKRAFFIIMVAYATTVVAMIPLWYAGAGLVRGFAVTTIVGITIGVFITRPAFASVIERWLNK